MAHTGLMIIINFPMEPFNMMEVTGKGRACIPEGLIYFPKGMF